MPEVLSYKTIDGKIFDTKEEAESYEKSLEDGSSVFLIVNGVGSLEHNMGYCDKYSLATKKVAELYKTNSKFQHSFCIKKLEKIC